MTESILTGIIIAVVLVVAFIPRLVSIEGRLRTISRLDSKLDALIKHSGIQFNPYEDVPLPVRDALERGKKIEAIKHYRAATGAGLQEAKEFVEELQRRKRK